MDPLSPFTHAPLPDSTTHIRLLEIQYGFFNQHVVCLLSAWALDAAPAYYAISYTWGDPALTANITINGQRMVVRQNCEYVLQQAFNLKASRYFWVDAVCIDQTSTQEKNHQVAMMGNIYKKAAQVLACVGVHGRDSEYLLEWLDKRENLLLEIHGNIQPNKFNNRLWGTWLMSRSIPGTRKLARRCYSTMSLKTRRRLVAAFLAFMRRPYFSRVWVLQELYLATQVSLCCGKDIHTFDSMLAFSMLVEVLIFRCAYLPYVVDYYLCELCLHFHRLSWWLSRLKRVGTPRNIDTFHGITSNMGCLELASGTGEPRHLEVVLDVMKDFQCADVRDKLYGVLAFVDWGAEQVPVPDYGKDSFEVAIEAMDFFLKDKKFSWRARDLHWARKLNEIFEVSKEPESFQRALQRRRDTAESMQEADGSGHRARFTDVVWYGTQIFYENPDDIHLRLERDATDGPQSSQMQPLKAKGLRTAYIRNRSDPQAHPDHMELMNRDGKFLALLPSDTREGDWFLGFNYLSMKAEEVDLGIIARASQDQHDQFTLIGQTNQEVNAKCPEMYTWRKFNIHWHPEDLLMFKWAEERHPWNWESGGALEEWLQTRICGTLHSSYAVETIDDKDISSAEQNPYLTLQQKQDNDTT